MDTRSTPDTSAQVIAKLNLLGESPAFGDWFGQIERFARCDATVLIDGETGTGKELTARAIHYLSERRDGPFIPINCGAIPDSLIGSELFGHTRGAFTDARESRAGLIAQAEGGTLFLDELETLSAAGQVALLRFLQDYQYRPLGAAQSRTADVRVVGATNADLAELARRGTFRQDLLYRLNVLSLDVPPLRERADDAVVLARAFVAKLSAHYGIERTLHAQALSAIRAHDWPGNVRELENLIHREFLLADEAELRILSLAKPDTSEADRRVNARRREDAARSGEPTTVASLSTLAFREAKARAIAGFERAYVRELLQRAQGNVSLAARLAGKERSRFNRLVRKYRIEAREFRAAGQAHAAR
jgi:DNA-binding NtrC family response regulator